MDLRLKDASTINDWEKIRKTGKDNGFSQATITCTELCLLNMLKFMSDLNMSNDNSMDFKKRELEIYKSHCKSIQTYFNALTAIEIDKSNFQEIIIKSLELAGFLNLNNIQQTAVIDYISSYWKYGEAFKTEVEVLRKEKKIF